MLPWWGNIFLTQSLLLRSYFFCGNHKKVWVSDLCSVPIHISVTHEYRIPFKKMLFWFYTKENGNKSSPLVFFRFSEMEKTKQTLRRNHWFQGQKWCEILPFMILLSSKKTFPSNSCTKKSTPIKITSPYLCHTFWRKFVSKKYKRFADTPKRWILFFNLKVKYLAHTSCLI